MTLRIRLLLLVLLSSTLLWGQPRPKPVAISSPSCLHTEGGQDTLCFPGGHQRFDSLYRKLDTLLLAQRGRVNILHIGGSHVQAGYFTERVRNRLAEGGFLPGNRGLLFPFKALKTNAPHGYAMWHEGEWNTCRCLSRDPQQPLGLSGASIEAADSAARIIFSLASLSVWRSDTLLVIGEGGAPLLVSQRDTLWPQLPDASSYHRFALSQGADTCQLLVPEGFRLRGILPEGRQAGITYTASGINGASVTSWLRCRQMEDDLALLPPDLVVMAIGVNDANVPPQQFDTAQFKANYRQFVGRIRRVSPGCCFIFVTNNDCWFNFRGRRRQFNSNTPLVRQAMTELAREYDGAVFDVFALMGGMRSSAAWVRGGLMRPDHIHFTRQGYELWGDLLYNALMKDYDR